VPEVSPEKNEPQPPEQNDGTGENRQRLSDGAVFILLAISVVALCLWWTRHLWLTWAGLSRG